MIDYCDSKLNVASRTLHFIDMQLDNEEKDFNSFTDFNDFRKWVKKACKRSIGFNENKKGYLETLRFIYELENGKEKINVFGLMSLDSDKVRELLNALWTLEDLLFYDNTITMSEVIKALEYVRDKKQNGLMQSTEDDEENYM